jgi:predicted nucleotidyltransferase
MEQFGIDESIIEDIVNIIRKYKEVTRAVIFGSRARGDYKKASDIDIALFGDNLTNTINTKIFFEIDELYMPYKVDLINFNTLGKENRIRENILKEGVEIYAK